MTVVLEIPNGSAPITATDALNIDGAEHQDVHARTNWWNAAAGRWDGVMPAATGSGDWTIFKDIGGTPTEHTSLDGSVSVVPDCIWDEASATLRCFFGRTGGHGSTGRYRTVSYDDGTDTYTLDSTTNPAVAMSGDQAPTQVITPNGDIWIFTASSGSDTILVTKSEDDAATWETPVALKAVSAGNGGAACAVTWSDGGTDYVGVVATEDGADASSQVHFLFIDSDSAGWSTAGNWTDESSSIPAYVGDEHADDELSAVVYDDDLYITTETEPGAGSRTNPDPQLIAYKRTAAGSWSRSTVREFNATTGDDVKRPSVAVWPSRSLVVVAGATFDNTTARIYYNDLEFSGSWESADVLTADGVSNDLYDTRLPRDPVTDTTRLLLTCSDLVTGDIWRQVISFAGLLGFGFTPFGRPGIWVH